MSLARSIASLLSGGGSVVLSSGGTMTGNLTVPSLNGGPLAGMRNRIINGAMMIDARNAGAALSFASGPASTYTLDRWSFGYSQNSKITAQQNQGSVIPPAGFSNYLGFTSASSYSVGAGDYFLLTQPIEGLNVSDLAWGTASAASVTLSFWVRSSLTGTFGGALRNSDTTRSYPFSYSISSANTWTQINIVIPGDTSGTWLTTNGVGVRVGFSLGIGSTFSGTAGTWASANYNSATGSVSVVGTSGATFYITGVQLEKGATATPFENRLYGAELALCQRYCWRIFGSGSPTLGSGYFSSTTALDAYVKFPVTMRALPTVTTGGTNPLGTYNATQNNAVLTLAFNTCVDSTGIRATSAIASYTANQAGVLVVNGTPSTNYIDFSSEL